MKSEKEQTNLKLPLNTEIKALIFTSRSKNPDVVSIKNYTDDYFNFKNRSYYIDFDDVMYFKRKKLLFGSVIYLFYHYDNDQPLQIDNRLKSVNTKRIPNGIIYTALKSDAIRKANDIKNNSLFDSNMIYYLIAGGVLIFVLFSMFGGA